MTASHVWVTQIPLTKIERDTDERLLQWRDAYVRFIASRVTNRADCIHARDFAFHLNDSTLKIHIPSSGYPGKMIQAKLIELFFPIDEVDAIVLEDKMILICRVKIL